MIAKLKNYYLASFIILAAAIIFLTINQGFKKSSLLLDTKENKFTLNFDLKREDQINLIEILDKLNLPQSLMSGISFELDSTSSASLIYLSPIESNLNIKENSISFSGKTSHSLFSKNDQIETIKIPKSSNLVLYSQHPIDFILNRNSYPQSLESWLKDNFQNERHGLLVFFGEEADYAIIIEVDGNNDLSLDNIFKEDQSEEFYKVETRDEISYHLINVNSNDNKEDKTLALFKLENWQVLTSSRQSAFTIADALKSRSQSVEFPVNESQNDSDFVVFYQNSDDYPIGQNLISLFFETDNFSQISPQNLKEKLQKVKSLNFALKANEFSGLIEFK